MSRHLTYSEEDNYRCALAQYEFDGTEGDRIVDALVVAMIAAGTDFVDITAATKMAKLQLHSLLKAVAPIEAMMNAIEAVERDR
jgi:hypothetical protein